MRFLRFLRFLASPVSLIAAGVSALSTLVLILSAAPAARAQANLTFSGGNGSPLSVTLASPITYTVTKAGSTNNSPAFLFQAVGGSSLGFPSATGTITFSINGGSAQTLNVVNEGVSLNDTNPNDFYTYGSAPGVAIGDIVTLTSGTLTTTPNIASAPPTGGTFTTFVIDGNGRRLSADGVSAAVGAPEPGTLPLVGMGVIGEQAKQTA